MAKNSKYSPEVQERAVRLVKEQEKEHGSLWASICSIAQKIGCTPETLRRWVKESEPAAVSAAEDRDRIKQLERENRELRRANEILKAASLYFAKAEFDRQSK